MPFDKSKFIDTYKTETREHIQKLNLGLLKLEKSPQDRELLESMMREAHTIKGSSSMMGYKRIADIAHQMEDGLDKALNKEILLDKIHFDILFKCLDSLEPLLEDKVTWADKGVARPFVEEICQEAERVFSGKASKKEAVKKSSLAEGAVKAGEDIAPKAQEPSAAPEDSMRVNIGEMDKIANLSGELLISKIRLAELVGNVDKKIETIPGAGDSLRATMRDLTRVSESINFLTEMMQEEVMKVRMVPVSYIFNTFPRAMRNLAAEQGKDVNFLVRGENTYLDKVILDGMRDPLMHLLRNALDHGIESAEERSSAGKSAQGKVTLDAYQEGSHVVIEVSDDGKGIDVDRVKGEAVKKGLVVKDKIKDIGDEEVYQLLFTPGFSTKDEVTDVSGRGVGLDVVKEAMTRLKGTVEVRSVKGKGASFILRLPLTLAIADSLLVAAGSDIFAIPVDSVIETVRITPEQVQTVEGKDAVSLRGQILPLLRLNDIFGLPRKGIVEKKYVPAVIVQSVEKKIGLLVDGLLGRQEIISKSIGEPLRNIKNIAGATILGSGRVILILDIPSIIESAEGIVIKRSAAKPRQVAAAKKKRTILLAEDVLTTAMLEKNILESVGYSVVIARDGKEALERARQETFDLVITDVLMPKMDGFELVESLRKEKLYKDVPIVIVTTRESDADKKRGLEAGADAYILKSEFTSEGLLETLERLLG